MQLRNKPALRKLHRHSLLLNATGALSTLAIIVLIGRVCAQEVSEYQVKAAYLYNFAKSGDWPAHALPEGPAPLVIGVLGGDEEFVNVLKNTVAGKTIGAHSIVVSHLGAGDDLSRCHIVFFRSSERKATAALVAALNSRDVLLVGEDAAFLREGGMINLVLDRGRIQFEISQSGLERTDIHFSPKFLSLAKTNSGPSNEHAEGSRQILIKISPEYPDIARQMKLKGVVQLEALVGRDGRVKEVTILGGHPLLADALSRAVKQWKYEPAAKESTELVRYSFDD